ncbi:MAG: hypothetical protein M1826_002165 [Phylliscum demangeonii]|nr:MAG: hypothetical protein M1826_002165 [Phylliscum demangeonii]
MADTGRKDVTSQLKEKVTPDSSKSTGQKLSENVSGTVDKGLGALQPESEKSTTQKLSDSTRSGADKSQNEGKGVLASVQDSAAGLAKSAGDTINQAADYVKGSTTTTNPK